MAATSVSKLQRLNGRNLQSSYGRRRKSNNWMRYPLILLLLFVVGGLAYAYYLWSSPVGRNEQTVYLYVRPETKFSDLRAQIDKKVWLRDSRFFNALCSWYGLADSLQAGRYEVTRETTASELIHNLSTGKQAPVSLTIGAFRTDDEILDFLSKNLMPRREELKASYASADILDSLHLTKDNFRSIFLTQTYQLNWNIAPKDLYKQIAGDYKAFWTKQRRTQADSIGLTPPEVITLASIIQSESSKPDEYARIAGLYMNRLRLKIKLQSDPTVKYALGRFDLKRILKEHLSVASPYNTYYTLGLPPGPIVLPRMETIDSVLNRETNNYLFMCARETFDGYHNFSAYYNEHLVNAKKYQEALDKRGIK